MTTPAPAPAVPSPAGTRLQLRPVLAGSMFAALLAVLAIPAVSTNRGLALYGMILFPILLAKLGLSLLPARSFPDNSLRVGVVVTVYNEDAELVRRCLASLHEQDRPPHRIVVVDDASSDLGAREVAALDPRVTLLVHRTNLGKREALATGFRALEGEVDVYACVDSDARLEPQALREGLKPFSAASVMAVTGLVVPSNHTHNLLTRLIDVRYVNAFLIERGAYSALRSVLCVCGVLAFYRADMIHRHLDAFLNQEFLGSRAVIGDDRHLTNRALLDGDALFAPHAIAHTAVPENVSHYLRQQSRWGRSFFRESVWALRHHHWRRPAWYLTVIEIAQWVVLTGLLCYILLVQPFQVGGMPIWDYFLFVALTAVARSVRYFDLARSDQSPRSRVATFMLTPLFGLLNLVVMIPVRAWSLLTLTKSGWGTRSVIEVTAEKPPAVPAALPG